MQLFSAGISPCLVITVILRNVLEVTATTTTSTDTPFSRPEPLPGIAKTQTTESAKPGVASMAMSKAELLREVKRQKDEHQL